MNIDCNAQNAIEIQRKQLQLLLKWLSIIDECDEKISARKDVDYYKACKAEAADGYATAMTSLIEVVINLSKFTL